MAFFENKEIKNRKAELSLRPDDPAAHFNLGTAYDKAGKIRDAVKEFEETIKIFYLGVLKIQQNFGSRSGTIVTLRELRAQ